MNREAVGEGLVRADAGQAQGIEERGAGDVDRLLVSFLGTVALAKGRHTPQRSCVACGQKLAKRELIRIVRTPQGSVIGDRTGKSAGRGAYLCRSITCWERGTGKGALERSLKLTLTAQDRAQLLAYYEEVVSGPPSEE